MFASDAVHPFHERPDWAAWQAKRILTKYYNPDVHYASFLLPTQLQTVLHGVPRLHQLAPNLFPNYAVPGVVQWPMKEAIKEAIKDAHDDAEATRPPHQ